MVCERSAGRPNVELDLRAMLRTVLSRASSHALWMQIYEIIFVYQIVLTKKYKIIFPLIGKGGLFGPPGVDKMQ